MNYSMSRIEPYRPGTEEFRLAKGLHTHLGEVIVRGERIAGSLQVSAGRYFDRSLTVIGRDQAFAIVFNTKGKQGVPPIAVLPTLVCLPFYPSAALGEVVDSEGIDKLTTSINNTRFSDEFSEARAVTAGAELSELMDRFYGPESPLAKFIPEQS